jgi:hypothetical protein
MWFGFEHRGLFILDIYCCIADHAPPHGVFMHI